MGIARGMVQTVRGPIPPETLGATLMHEHVFCDITPPELAAQVEPDVEIALENVWEIRHHWWRHMGNSRLDDEDLAAAELGLLREAGGRALVDVTSIGIKPNPAALERVSRSSGVHIVAGCGYYTEPFQDPAFAESSIDALAAGMIRDVAEGVGETGIKAGIIGEIGCSGRWTEVERKVMRAAVFAQQETGAAITIHPPRFPFPVSEVVEVVREAGGDVGRTIIGHIDRTIFDQTTLFRLADTGCVIEYDFFGIEASYYPFQEEIDLPNDGMRLELIRSLVARGHVRQVLISQDICTKTRLVRFGGHGYGHIFRNVVSSMRRKGFDEKDIRIILEETPRALLTLQ